MCTLQVCLSENRIAVIEKNNSVHVWTKGVHKILNFQPSDPVLENKTELPLSSDNLPKSSVDSKTKLKIVEIEDGVLITYDSGKNLIFLLKY